MHGTVLARYQLLYVAGCNRANVRYLQIICYLAHGRISCTIVRHLVVFELSTTGIYESFAKSQPTLIPSLYRNQVVGSCAGRNFRDIVRIIRRAQVVRLCPCCSACVSVSFTLIVSCRDEAPGTVAR